MFFEFPSANLDVSGLETGIKEFKYLCDVFQQVVYLWRFWDRVCFFRPCECVCVYVLVFVGMIPDATWTWEICVIE